MNTLLKWMEWEHACGAISSFREVSILMTNLSVEELFIVLEKFDTNIP